ncbi:hypothetical protein K469DRAFT_621120 [Zopfia rhizophila CBS 207.26]|uniref:DUF8004 domain-containing protein n=1 Tax=Zopfia rhizophila CBS 207.26 TaxID=1314779 RepID=A0A6A6ENT9_9PEZI|nr:hypothetical protein K469DRAFT_621120 [Zopfia rhizophila CBS 207.26]
MTSALLWGSAKSTAKRPSLVAEDGRFLKLLESPSAIRFPRDHTSGDTSNNINLIKRPFSCSTAMRNPTRAARVKRWAGLTRKVTDWDGLRRDSELWFDNGDCLIHLYSYGQSRRGPSFRVPSEALRQSKCGAMFSLCFAQMTPGSGSNIQTSSRVSSRFATPVSRTSTCELYIPAPEDASKEASFQWHITTRNFFAFIFRKPLVGNHLGKALVDLQERMRLFRSGQINNYEDFLEYAENQGYRGFVNCADYALAMLYYAEHYQLRDVWVDAFVHCVGMNDSLSRSTEFEPISRVTKALITRAYLEMDIHLGHVMVALSNFLEDDMSPTFLGLGDGARAHLDRFRSFLHSFYVEKFGYWPPPKGSAFSKTLYRSMYFDFQNLYDYLVDMESTDDISSQKPASGGICVLQNVQAFDKRRDFTPLPHPMPLLPEYSAPNRKTQSQKTLRSFTLGSKQAKTDRYMTTRAALTAATNTRDVSVTGSLLVKEYMRFERQCALNQREEKVSMADARKVRWLLIYGVLQYLISAIRAPKEVRDTEKPCYPLCCLVAGTLPWQMRTKVLNSPAIPSVNVPDTINAYLSETSCEVSNELTPGAPKLVTIQPDCATEDYFTHTNPKSTPMTSRPVSVEVPGPLRISSPISRSTSTRSFKHLSLSALSSRRNSVIVKAPSRPYCEIIVHGYGNGLNETIIDPPSQAVSRSESPNRSKRFSTLPDGAGPHTSWFRSPTPDYIGCSRRPSKLELNLSDVHEQIRTPVMESFQIDQLVSPTTSNESHDSPASSNSTTSVHSAVWSDEASSASSKSSISAEPSDSTCKNIEDSGLLGGFVPVDTTPTSTPKKPKKPSSSKTTSPATPTRRGEFRFNFNESPNERETEVMHLTESPVSIGSDSMIGVAISAPSPPLLPATAFPFDILPVFDETPKLLVKSFSTDSLATLKSTKPRTHGRNESVMDIFAALSLKSAEPGVPQGRSASEVSREIEAAIPPPILKASKVKAPQAKVGKAADEEERGGKEKRKSFGIYLRRK